METRLQVVPVVRLHGSCLSSSEHSLPFCCRLSSSFPGPSPPTAVSSEPNFLVPVNGIQGKKTWGPVAGLCSLGKARPPAHPWMLCVFLSSRVSGSVRPRRRQPTRLPRLWDSSGKNTGVGCHFLLQCIKVKMHPQTGKGPCSEDPINLP